mmetsp:Transcript_9880/g.25396  ORF Transcript_9880/g.25396 Transcript_9880/m.25396 type:complete len:211 (+) Transcript_9880:293-925(+)
MGNNICDAVVEESPVHAQALAAREQLVHGQELRAVLPHLLLLLLLLLGRLRVEARDGVDERARERVVVRVGRGEADGLGAAVGGGPDRGHEPAQLLVLGGPRSLVLGARPAPRGRPARRERVPAQAEALVPAARRRDVHRQALAVRARQRRLARLLGHERRGLPCARHARLPLVLHVKRLHAARGDLRAARKRHAQSAQRRHGGNLAYVR